MQARKLSTEELRSLPQGIVGQEIVDSEKELAESSGDSEGSGDDHRSPSNKALQVRTRRQTAEPAA